MITYNSGILISNGGYLDTAPQPEPTPIGDRVVRFKFF